MNQIINTQGAKGKKLAILLSTFLFSLITFAQHTHADGSIHDDHSAAEPAIEVKKMQKSEAVSDRYELVLKYEHFHADEAEKMTLYLADPATNRAIEGAKIVLSASLDSKAQFNIKPKEAGVYEVEALFSKERKFALTAKIDGSNGPDLLMLRGLQVGHDESEHTHEAETPATAWYQNSYFWGSGGLLLGMLLMYLLMRVRNKKLMVWLLIMASVWPTAQNQPTFAQHEGHNHGDEGDNAATNLSNEFDVPKETQFLFEILTQPLNEGAFDETVQLYGHDCAKFDRASGGTNPTNGEISGVKCPCRSKSEQRADAGNARTNP